MVYKRINDKGKLSESDPTMKRFLDPDIARRKERFWKFSDKVKQVLPDVTPVLRLKAENLCDQCEVAPWTHKVRVQKSISDHMSFDMCSQCYGTLLILCQTKGFRVHLLFERPAI